MFVSSCSPAPQVSRLDVHAFLALLQEAGGPAVQHHMAHWAATPLKLEGQEGEGQEGQHKGQEGAASSNEGGKRGVLRDPVCTTGCWNKVHPDGPARRHLTTRNALWTGPVLPLLRPTRPLRSGPGRHGHSGPPS